MQFYWQCFLPQTHHVGGPSKIIGALIAALMIVTSCAPATKVPGVQLLVNDSYRKTIGLIEDIAFTGPGITSYNLFLFLNTEHSEDSWYTPDKSFGLNLVFEDSSMLNTRCKPPFSLEYFTDNDVELQLITNNTTLDLGNPFLACKHRMVSFDFSLNDLVQVTEANTVTLRLTYNEYELKNGKVVKISKRNQRFTLPDEHLSYFRDFLRESRFSNFGTW
jgi:hypothetical protein